MPKTYGTVTTFTAGSVLTAAQMNVAGGAINNLVVPAAARAIRTTQQTIANATVTALNFTGTAAFDTDSMTTASGLYLTINTPGLYVVSASVGWGAIIAGGRMLYLYLNPTITGSGDSATVSGGTGITGSFLTSVGSTTAQTSQAVSTVYNFAAGDKIVAGLYQTSGGNLNTDNAASTHLAAAWVGRTS